MRRIIFTLLILLVASSLVTAQFVGQSYIAVIDLDITGGISHTYQRPLSDRLRQELVNTGRFTVVERNNMESVLGEQGFQLSGCTSDECAIEVGRVLGVEKILAGSLAKVGDTHTINLRLIDVESGKIMRAKSTDCQCTIDEILTTKIRDAALLMAGYQTDGELEANEPIVLIGEGDLFIKSDPAGAEIFLDGRKLSEVTPHAVEKLKAGEHLVRLKKFDLVGHSMIMVQPDDITKIEIPLEKGRASLKVYSNPLEATLILDGETIGLTPQMIGDLPAGDHTLRFIKAGYVTHEEQVSIASADKKRVEVDLIKTGSILINSNPKSARISLNGESVGVAPLALNDLNPDYYDIRAEMGGYRTWSQGFKIDPGEIEEVQIDLVRKKGSIKISSSIEDALIKLNDDTLLTVPALVEDLTLGEYTVEISAPDRETFIEVVKVNAEKTYNVFAELIMLQGTLSFSELPVGTIVVLEDSGLGTAPLDDIKIDIGIYRLFQSRPGYEEGAIHHVEVKHNEVTEVPLTLTPKTNTKALIRSALCPGLGQLYAERSSIGYTYAASEALALGYVVYSIVNYNSKVNDYNDADEAYHWAVFPDDIAAKYEEKKNRFDEISPAKTQIIISSVIAGGVYLWNLIDARYIGIRQYSENEINFENEESSALGIHFYQDSNNKTYIGIKYSVPLDNVWRASK
ncbi:MAG: PEGA domain-containing protein [Candidatus Electryonea clarkiae]|nr:PEGA domain-containing protein [Candidatus Electryonea clarkiae]MDP8289280.1 PEGA domain-containing protein [Candidatus Electryonea clarkiae]